MFSIKAECGKARLSSLELKNGTIDLPTFMPVGTCASVKGLTSDLLKQTGSQIILGNTYHLMLRNAAERIGSLGGLQNFMNWKGPILTDSGGFQVMSLSGLRKITEEGVTFRSHIDGEKHFMTPERSVQIQDLLGADITMVLDECIKYPATYKKAKKAMLLSWRWAGRSKEAFRQEKGRMLFGIVQGGMFKDLREDSARLTMQVGFDGYAIGGLAVGEGLEKMVEVLDYTVPLLPKDKPRYVMGIGKPIDIISAVLKGVDMFDCVLPTRNARNGYVYTRTGEVKIRNAKHESVSSPLDPHCGCFACKNHSTAYLHHLFKAKEMLAATLLTAHNLTFYQDMMAQLRSTIKAGDQNALEEVLLMTQNGDYSWIGTRHG